MLTTALVVLALTVPAAWLYGRAAAAGVLAGGALAVVDFGWLAARAVAAPGASWLAGAGLRLTTCLAAIAVLLATGVAHPVAVLVGFTVLPCAVIGQGLALAREEGRA